MASVSNKVMPVLCTLLAAFALVSCQKTPSTEPGKLPDLGALPAQGFYNNAEGSPLLKVLDGAQASLDIEIYQMADSDVRTAIRSALSRNVRVRVVKEPSPVGDSCNVFTEIRDNDESVCADQKRLRSQILAAGGSYVPFNKATLCADASKSCVEHGKMVIADGKEVLVSSGNFNSSNLCNLAANPKVCDRDYTMIEAKPEIVSFLSAVFEKDLKGEKYDLQSMLQAGPKEQVTVSPYSMEPLIAMVQSAKSSIQIENQYLKEPTLNQALAAAAQRGVKVEVTVASACSFGPPSARDREELLSTMGALQDAGASVRFLPSQFQIDGKPGYLHAKALVIDGQVGWVGSVNGSWPALSNNREFGIIFQETDWVNSLASVLSSDHASPDMETLDETLDCAKDNSSGDSTTSQGR